MINLLIKAACSCKKIVCIIKSTLFKLVVSGGQMYFAFPFSKGSLKRKMGVHLFLHMDFLWN